MITVSAPAKIIIIGDHSVVYGKPAIIAAVNKHCYVRAKPSNKIKIKDKKLNIDAQFSLKDTLSFVENLNTIWNSCFKKKRFSELFALLEKDEMKARAMIGRALEKLNLNTGISITIDSEIPIGTGLGSSAATAVAITKAISTLYKKNLTKEKVNEIAYEIEKFNHGTPSGGDNTISCFGGILFFEKGKFKRLKIPPFLKKIVIALTKRKHLTGELIQKVSSLDEKLKESLIKGLGRNAIKIKKIIQNGDFESFKKIINQTQDNLKKLEVSTPLIDEISKEIRKIGGAAKLSGAGGGGIILCFHENREKLISLLKKLGLNFFEAKIEKEGVQIKKI